MSWLGVKYAFADRDERIKGGVRLTFVAIGARVEYRRITTSPTSLGELDWLTFRSHEQLRRDIDFLEAIKKVRRLRRGKNAIYALPGMAGPLFAVDDGDPVTRSRCERHWYRIVHRSTAWPPFQSQATPLVLERSISEADFVNSEGTIA